MNKTLTMQEEYLLERIIDITTDEKSRNYYIKAINILGPNIVESELGELKSQIMEGRYKNKNIQNPGAYLTALLEKRLEKIPEDKRPAPEDKSAGPSTHFEQSQRELIKHLKPIDRPAREEAELKTTFLPFSRKYIPWPTFIGSEFFTLSTNKKKSDKVNYSSRTMDGSVIQIPLIRGKISKGSKKDYGILTVQHAKVFDALKLAWVNKGQKYEEYSNGSLFCYVRVTARELAEYLGWKSFGGWEMEKLKTAIADLKSMPYYLCLEELDYKGIKGYGFYLISDFSLVDRKTRGGKETVFDVSFSSTVSWQLLNKHAVSRSKELLNIRSEMAYIIRVYAEPKALSSESGEFSIYLNNLVEQLQLPTAKWHQHKGKRKEQFSKAIKELEGSFTTDGRQLIFSIEKGLHDHLLVVKVKGEPVKKLEK